MPDRLPEGAAESGDAATIDVHDPRMQRAMCESRFKKMIMPADAIRIAVAVDPPYSLTGARGHLFERCGQIVVAQQHEGVVQGGSVCHSLDLIEMSVRIAAKIKHGRSPVCVVSPDAGQVAVLASRE